MPSETPLFRRLLVVIKQTAYEEYSQVAFLLLIVVVAVIVIVVAFYFLQSEILMFGWISKLSHQVTHFYSPNISPLQLKLRGQAPKALRWARLESRYHSHKACVESLLSILRDNNVAFSCINRVELDRQHLADVDLMIAVGGDGTVLSAAHFLDHGTIPLLGINSDPISEEDKWVTVLLFIMIHSIK